MNGKHQKSLIALRFWLLGKNYQIASLALDFAIAHHKGLRKDGKTPEFAHQLIVTQYLRTMSGIFSFPEETLAASLLHDVVEDYAIDPHIIFHQFGANVGTAVMVLSKVVGGVKKDNTHYYYEIGQNAIASVVKGGDRIHNFQSMVGVFSHQKQVDYMQEGEDFTLRMLKCARRNFPAQEPIYENQKLILESQIELIRAVHAGGGV